LKQKRILRRYLRLKRNNFAKRYADQLVDKFYVDNWLPKIEQVLQENKDFLNEISGGYKETIEVSSYSPISYEMNVTPVIAKLLETSTLNLNHSLPIVEKKEEPLVFREYRWGDDLVKSEMF
jgi:5-formyltetrahydrofolate cyclo-ligase